MALGELRGIYGRLWLFCQPSGVKKLADTALLPDQIPTKGSNGLFAKLGACFGASAFACAKMKIYRYSFTFSAMAVNISLWLVLGKYLLKSCN